MNATKSILRTELLDSRRAVPEQARQIANEVLVSKMCELAQGKKVSAYAPFGVEPGGSLLLNSLFDASAQLWLPISGPESTLFWALYSGPEEISHGALGIIEPTGPRRDSSILNELDLLFIPAMGVNAEGYRLGKGAGYYDRALVGINTQKIAVVYESEIREDIPVESHDVPVDAILTEKGLRNLS